MLFKNVAAAAALMAVSSAQSITSLSPAQSSAILSVWSVYSKTVGDNLSVIGVVNSVATAVPSSDLTAKTSSTATSINIVSYLNNPPSVALPYWMSDLPSSLSKAYGAILTSVESERVTLGREVATESLSAATSTSSASSTASTAAASSSSSASSGSAATSAVASSTLTASVATYTGAAAMATSNAFLKVAGVAAGAVGAAALLL